MSRQSLSVKISLLLLFLVSSFFGISQKNSPWKKLSNQTISGVYFGLGRHTYSLTNGQGFSVYLKNYSDAAVTVSGKVVAKTICGNEVTTNFSTTLLTNQESSGGNFADSSNSQTGVVTADNCVGKKYFISPKVAVTNRIQDVFLRDIQVQSLGSTSETTTTAPTVNVITPETKKVPKIILPNISTPKQPTINLDSIKYALINDSIQKLNKRVDSINSINFSIKQALDAANKKYADSIAKRASLLVVPEKKIIKSFDYTLSPYIGIGWEQLPIITNDKDTALSANSTTGHPLITAGLKFSFFNNSPFTLQVDPFASYGFNIGSVTGTHWAYGGLVTLLGNLNHAGNLRAFIEGGGIGRNGTWSKNVTEGIKKTAQIGDYQYGLWRFGAGIKYQWGNGWYIKPGVFWDNVSTFTSGSSPAILGDVKLLMGGKWILDISYGSNYFTNSAIVNIPNYKKVNENYLGIKLLYNIKTFSIN